MITVNKASDYQRDFPEQFNWALIDTISLSEVAIKVARDIKFDLNTKDRNYVPGLRHALNIIADSAKIEGGTARCLDEIEMEWQEREIR